VGNFNASAAFKRTQLTWEADPAPAEPYFTVFWFAFTYAMNSGSVFPGKFFGVMIARGASTTSPSGVKSVSVL
jgi:hypothetical protein